MGFCARVGVHARHRARECTPTHTPTPTNLLFTLTNSNPPTHHTLSRARAQVAPTVRFSLRSAGCSASSGSTTTSRASLAISPIHARTRPPLCSRNRTQPTSRTGVRCAAHGVHRRAGAAARCAPRGAAPARGARNREGEADARSRASVGSVGSVRWFSVSGFGFREASPSSAA